MNTVLISSADGPAPVSKMTRAWAVMSWLPIVAFLVPVAFAAIAFVRVGHWPFYSHPDPKDLDLPFLRAAALLCYPLSLLSILARLLGMVIWSEGFRKRELIAFFVGGVLWTLGLPILGPIFGWLAD